MDVVRIALAQINPTVGDLKGNVASIVAATRRARDCGAQIVTFPELAICGYPPEDLLIKPRFLRDCRDALAAVAGQSNDIIAVVGFPHVARGKVYNAAAVIDDTRLGPIYHKVELPNYGVFDEKRYFSRGRGCAAMEVHGTRICVTICEDLWVKSGPVERHVVRKEAGIVLNISASPFHAGKLSLRRQILSDFARRVGAFVCYTNLVGGQDELVFDGGSMVLSPQGELLASAKRFEEDLILADIETGLGGQEGTSATPRAGTIPATPALEPGRLEEIYRALVLGTGDYVRKNAFEKVVLGLSGGIDSSLTAAIAVDATGEGGVIGITMPSRYTSGDTLSDAELVASNLGIPLMTVPVERIFAAYLEELREAFGPGEPGVENENLQARIRGNILMALSNRFGWLVLSTGNKSEVAVGYCTLYGDMAGGFAVIKDVPKTLVYELARYVNRKAGRDLIPPSVMQRPPSAELKPDQRDEDSLPPYARLDPILRAYVEEDVAPDEIVNAGFERAIVGEVVRMVDRNEYKRRQAAPGVKITPKAFGKDRRMPITNRYTVDTGEG